MADREITDLLRQAAENPVYKDLTDYLMLRRAMPEVRQAYMGEGTRGEFTWGDRLPPAGVIKVANPSSPTAVTTLLHELTHAAQRQTVNQYYDSVKAGETTQLTDAYNKLNFAPGWDFQARYKDIALIEGLPGGKEWLKTDSGYRTGDSERNAFAVGNSAAPAGASEGSQAPNHIDPTVATDFLMLLQAAIADMSKRSGPQGR